MESLHEIFNVCVGDVQLGDVGPVKSLFELDHNLVVLRLWLLVDDENLGALLARLNLAIFISYMRLYAPSNSAWGVLLLLVRLVGIKCDNFVFLHDLC